MKLIITERVTPICDGQTVCNCPTVSGDKACDLFRLANFFLTETNPVSYELSDVDYGALVMYAALASLRK